MPKFVTVELQVDIEVPENWTDTPETLLEIKEQALKSSMARLHLVWFNNEIIADGYTYDRIALGSKS